MCVGSERKEAPARDGALVLFLFFEAVESFLDCRSDEHRHVFFVAAHALDDIWRQANHRDFQAESWTAWAAHLLQAFRESVIRNSFREEQLWWR